VLEIAKEPDPLFDAEHGSRHHAEGQDPVDIAQLPVPHGRDDALARDVGHVDARRHVARKPEDDERRSHHVPATNTNEAADNTDGEAGEDQKYPWRLDARNQELEHGTLS